MKTARKISSVRVSTSRKRIPSRAQAAQAAALAAEQERLLLEQLPQVYFIARRIREKLPQHVALEDLVHAGVLGLMDAVRKYDVAKNVQLKSYAKFRIRGAILDSLRELDWSPRELRRKGRRLEEAQNKLRTLLGRTPSEDELARELGMELLDFQHLLASLRGLDLGSLRNDLNEDGREEDIANLVPTDPDDDPFHQCLRGEMKQLLAQAISELPEKERQVLSLYYFEEATMKEVGAALGVGESRVSQIHSAALVHIRARLREFMPERGATVRAAAPIPTRFVPPALPRARSFAAHA